jgi:hypothetical protein
MSLGVLEEYAGSLFAASPSTYIFFPHLIIFRVCGDDFVYHNNHNLLYSPYTLKYFPSILQICLDTFHAFSVDA